MVTWQEFMLERVEGREVGMPWFLHDKVRCYEYLAGLGVPTAPVLRRFSAPTQIDLDGLPDEFVLKPTLQSSTKGVMVLSREDGGWRDAIQRRSLTEQQIIEEQTLLFDEAPRAGNQIIVEQKITDIDGCHIPRDFKAYCFRGIIALMLQIDRNTKPATVSWFDGAFRPIDDGRVWSNPAYVDERSAEPPSRAWSLLRVASLLSASLPTPFASVDMYLTPEGPLVGEVTLAPGGLYHGVHYRLSRDQQRLMGWMWEHALQDVAG